jgi:hypothetical protein
MVAGSRSCSVPKSSRVNAITSKCPTRENTLLDQGKGKIQLSRDSPRVGIVTGLVVDHLIGHGSAQAQSVVGETRTLPPAASWAERGAVIIAASTRRLVGNLFEYCDLGAAEVELDYMRRHLSRVFEPGERRRGLISATA